MCSRRVLVKFFEVLLSYCGLEQEQDVGQRRKDTRCRSTASEDGVWGGQGYLYFNTVLQAKGTGSGKGGDEQGFEDSGNISPRHASRSSSPARAKAGSRKVSAASRYTVHTFPQCPNPQPHVITRSRFVPHALSRKERA